MALSILLAVHSNLRAGDEGGEIVELLQDQELQKLPQDKEIKTLRH